VQVDSERKKAVEKSEEQNPIPGNRNSDMGYLFGVVALVGIFLFYCKFIKPKFDSTAKLIYEYSGSTTDYELAPMTGFCSRKITVGSGRTIDINLGDTEFVLTPKSNSRILLKVKSGILRNNSDPEEKSLGEGDKIIIEQKSEFEIDNQRIIIVPETFEGGDF